AGPAPMIRRSSWLSLMYCGIRCDEISHMIPQRPDLVNRESRFKIVLRDLSKRMRVEASARPANRNPSETCQAIV
ncbi:MAG TPA: hypothetical protein VN920_05295, partial [Pyrinomonadaceae bacterium]|nr:hypothetical protein [Pyrinomonadaceae bacterium]